MRVRLTELLGVCRNAPSLAIQTDYAFRIILELYPRLVAFIRRRCEAHLFEDIWDRTRDRLAAGLPKCRATSDEELWSWCVTIARRSIAQVFRTQQKQLKRLCAEEVLEEVAATTAKQPDAIAAERLDTELVLRVLAAASPECRDLLIERYIEELPYRESRRNASEGDDAVRKRVARCLELARGLLDAGVRVSSSHQRGPRS